jgi:hypothetical protein
MPSAFAAFSVEDVCAGLVDFLSSVVHDSKNRPVETLPTSRVFIDLLLSIV